MTATQPSSVPHGIERLLTPEDLYAMTQISPKTLSNWRYIGRGPAFVKDGGCIRYRMSDVAEWLNAKRVATDA